MTASLYEICLQSHFTVCTEKLHGGSAKEVVTQSVHHIPVCS